MKFNTEIKAITKAAKKAGLELVTGKGSHIKLVAPNGEHETLSGGGKKTTSPGVAKKCWTLINKQGS